MYERKRMMGKIDKIEKELSLKEQRVSFWEKYHCIPTHYDLMRWDDLTSWGLEAET